MRLDPAEAEGGDRDYILRYRLDGAQVESGLLLYPGPEESFFLLLRVGEVRRGTVKTDASCTVAVAKPRPGRGR